MATISLAASPRSGTGKGAARSLRRKGRVPAVLYGGDLEAPVHISIDAHETELLFRSVSVENTIINLTITDNRSGDEEGDGDAEASEADSYRTLVREVQTHPWKGSLLHVDFLRIRRGVTVDLQVPLHLMGTPVGVTLGGVVEQVLHDLPVRCIPSKIPEALEVDIASLAIGDSLTVADIDLGEGVEVTIEDVRTVCTVSAPRVAEEEEEEEDQDVLDAGIVEE